ncbi:MAG: radical SAM protein [Bacillota bacterium]
MRYEGTVYRPPSEAYSLIVQATIGCSHNQCTFCSMYKDKKFRIRSNEEIIEDLVIARSQYKHIKKIFIADGNALVMRTKDLEIILTRIHEIFPECERVGIYAAPKDILRKKDEELEKLKDLGLGIVYLGVESGSDKILENIKKGAAAQEIIEAGQKIKASGIKLSVTLISGIGGKTDWEIHGIESAKVVNAINPDYLSLLTLLLQEGTPMYEQVREEKMTLLTPKEIMMETRSLIENLNLKEPCIFRSNHASNYVALQGTLPKDKEELLIQIDIGLRTEFDYRDEYFRRL